MNERTNVHAAAALALVLILLLPQPGSGQGVPCRIDGIRAVQQRPDRVTFRVAYSIPPTYPEACYISARVPSAAEWSSRFGVTPAGRRPDGVPKGTRRYASDVEFTVHFAGSQPMTTSTIEVQIYDRERTLCTRVFPWQQTWRKRAQLPFEARLSRSLLARTALEKMRWDYDRDGLLDDQEGKLANAFRPYCLFDSDEGARAPHEPVLLFQMRPLDLRDQTSMRVKIKWGFLFRRDGGYGPSSDCSNDHAGDDDEAYAELLSTDGGVTWRLVKMGLGGGDGLTWTSPHAGLEVYGTHPVIYMSAHKHHEYFNSGYNHRDSYYSDWGCNDDVDGRGDLILPDLSSLRAAPGFYNNVGEPEAHPEIRFVNSLRRYFPGHSAWGPEKFYAVRPVRSLWMTHSWQHGMLAPQQIAPMNGEVFSHFPRRTTLQWQAVAGAARYKIEVEYKGGGKWYTLLRPRLVSGTQYTFDFVGAQPGRWRVWAVDAQGHEGPKSGWWEFRFTK